MTELLDGYKPDIKPARNANTPINITFNFELYRIEGLVSAIFYSVEKET